MKNIFVTIEYVAKKILEAITGHKSDPQAHPNLSEQINVLLEKAVTGCEYKSILNLNDITKTDLYQYSDFSTEGRVGAPDNYVGVVFHKQLASGYAFQTAWSMSGKRYERKQLASIWSDWEPQPTATKTDISLLNGWTVYVGEVNAVKIGNLVTIPDVRLKGGIGTKGTILFNLPQGFRPPKTRHVMTIKNGTTPTLLTVGSNGNVAILYDDFVGASDISYTVGFSFLTE